MSRSCRRSKATGELLEGFEAAPVAEAVRRGLATNFCRLETETSEHNSCISHVALLCVIPIGWSDVSQVGGQMYC